MAEDHETDEEELEENEVAFFKCKKCGSRTLYVTWIIDATETCESVLPCRCGNEETAIHQRERIVTQEQRTGYVTQDRHIHIDEHDELEELERDVEDEQIACEDCYEKYGDQLQLWEQTKSDVDEDDEGSDLTITCDGCGREIEFGYSHPNKQGRIFLGEDDTDFNPWLTFPDPKYFEKWKRKGWLRPTTPKSHRTRCSKGPEKEGEG